MEENQIQKLEWSALEYEEKEQTIDWFWALGIIIIASAVTSIIFENYFCNTHCLGRNIARSFYYQKPEMVSYELNDKGLKIKNRLFLMKI